MLYICKIFFSCMQLCCSIQPHLACIKLYLTLNDLHLNVWMNVKNARRNSFYIIREEENFLNFNTCCTILVYFPQNSVCCITLSFSFQIMLTLFINRAQKFEYQHSHLKLKVNVNFTAYCMSTFHWKDSRGFG